MEASHIDLIVKVAGFFEPIVQCSKIETKQMKISVISNHFSDVSFKWEKETSGYTSNSFIIYLYSEVKKKTLQFNLQFNPVDTTDIHYKHSSENILKLRVYIRKNNLMYRCFDH